MQIKVLWLALILLVACGKDGSSPKNVLGPQTDTQTTPVEPVPPQIDRREFAKISDLLPTMYYVPQEANVNCRGTYGQGGPTYNGTETTSVVDVSGRVIAVVCTRFYKFLLMEGSAILKNRGNGEVAINYGGVVGGERRYHTLGRCVLGEGVRRDLCLLPYHTIASDNKVHKIGEIIYVPKADGLVLPDGTVHEGYFIVRDTGGAFNGIGAQRIDLFTGTDPDYNNVFLKAGFNHKTPMQAFKIQGASAEYVKQRLKDRFGELY